MNSPARIALSAVLIALCAIMPVSGMASPLGGSPAAARLDPGRVFAPADDSLFAPLVVPRSTSFVTAYVFDDIAPLMQLLAFDRAPELSIGTGRGAATVNLSAPQVASTFVPRLPGAAYAPLPSFNDASAVPVAPQVALAAPSALPLATASPVMAVRFGTYSAYTAPVRENDGSPVDVHLGNLRFETAFHAMQMCGTADEADACRWSADAPAQAQSFSAGTDFNVRAGSRDLNVQLSSGIAHINPASANVFRYVPLDDNDSSGLTYAGLGDVVEQNVGAGLAVPVNHRLTVGLQFNRSYYQGDYTSPLSPNYSAMRDTYLGNVTYQLPGSSALTLSARQFRYQDLLAPNFNVTETRADLNFTVKF